MKVNMWSLSILLTIVGAAQVFAQDLNNHTFSDAFMFGVATAAYQVEGAWNIDGKGENIWDRYVHENQDLVADGSNADIACDSYHKYKEDIQMLKDMGVNHYRLSLSWSRILPTGFSNKLNDAGVLYYRNLIRELKNNSIEPLVTLYHWDLPQPLQEAGGWESENMVGWFADYAKTCFRLFGDDVKFWMTFNEAKQTCWGGYGGAAFAPGYKSAGIGEYICAHNVLKAHAAAWHVYDELFRPFQDGQVGIVIDSAWYQPETNSTEDIAAAETALQFTYGWYANPLLKGDYPEVMKAIIDRRSATQGYKKSRLPVFTDEEIQFMNGTVDLLGVNIYTANVVRHIANPDLTAIGYYSDMEVDTYQPSDWPSSASSWLKVTPWAMRGLTNWIKNTYGNPRMIITENGVSDDGSTLDDDIRTTYYQGYLSSLRDAIEFDNVNVLGYTAWSLMDNFEWMRGYSEKFGFYHVDFESENRTRTPKKSLEYYKKVLRTRCLVDECVDS